MPERLLSKTIAVPLLAVALLFAGLDVARAHLRDHRKSTGKTIAAHRPTKPVTHAVDPLNTAAMRHYIDSRSGDITVAVENLLTGATYLWNPEERAQTGSIIKADILETLLRQAMESHTPISESTASVVQGMIEDSDNDDATDLWNQVGGAGAISAYNQLVGMTQTDPNTEGYWGETTTSALDQIRLLRELVDKHGLLDSASQRYQLGLMENVVSGQNWGVSGGIPAGVSIALKNGWLPLTSYTDWEINSIGRIKGDGRWYLITVLTAHDPSEQYGIDTIQGISSLVWGALPPARRPS
ncbi:MAG TPA: serine hydrolase [Solirubrobacteraceae bacterium]|nr:serine hydrolase [Solirubrobacteraceae bacterium]